MQKECPNPTCKAHIEQWEFYENEEYCSVCGTRLRTGGGPAISVAAQPSNTAGMVAATNNEPYIDSFMQVRNTNNTWLVALGLIAALVIVFLVVFFLFRNFLPVSNSNTAGTSISDTAATQTAVAQANATSTAAIRQQTPVLPIGNLTPGTGLPQPAGTYQPNPGGFPTATPAVNANLAEAPPPVIDTSARAMLQNIGMVTSCDDSAPRTTYRTTESFYIMVQGNYNHTQVREVHTVWYGPPGFNTVYNAAQGSLSIDNPDTSKRLRDGGDYYICFKVDPQPAGMRWQPGNYRVVVYINDNIAVDSRQFYVSPLSNLNHDTKHRLNT